MPFHLPIMDHIGHRSQRQQRRGHAYQKQMIQLSHEPPSYRKNSYAAKCHFSGGRLGVLYRTTLHCMLAQLES